MTAHSQSSAVKAILVLLGLCICLVLGWLAVSVTSPAKADQEIAKEVGSFEQESHDLAPATATEIASATSVSGKDVGIVEKPPLGEIKILIPTKEFRTEGPQKALRVDFSDIDVERVLNTKELSVDLPQAMPDWLKNLNGQRVRVRGYMHPGSAFQAEGIKQFVLCRDTFNMNFGPAPTIHHFIETTLKAGTSTSFVDGKAMDVEGIFRIEPVVHESGDIVGFYHLNDAQVVKVGR